MIRMSQADGFPSRGCLCFWLAVAQDLSVAQPGRRLAGTRWLQRVAHHVWRVSAHLGGYDLREEAAVELDGN